MEFKDYLKMSRMKLGVKRKKHITQTGMVHELNKAGVDTNLPQYSSWEGGRVTEPRHGIKEIKKAIKEILS